MSILTLPEAERAVGIPEDYIGPDLDELQAYVNGITKPIEDYLNQVVEQREITEEHCIAHARSVVLRNWPVISLTSVEAVDGSTMWDVSGIRIVPGTSRVKITTGAPFVGELTFVYQAGYAEDSVPENFKRGAAIILQHVWETQRGIGGVMPGVDESNDYNPRFSTYTLPRRALEWLGSPMPAVG